MVADAEDELAVHRKAAVVALAGLIYYVFATELAGMLKPKEQESKDDPPVRKKVVPTVSRRPVQHSSTARRSAQSRSGY